MFLTLDDLVFDREVDELYRRYGMVPRTHHRLQTVDAMRREWHRKLAERRGEVLFALQRPDGHVLLHTKADYPIDVYRLLGGGIRWNEPVAAALSREVGEETGFEVSGERLVGILTYEFAGTDTPDPAATPFVSYVFVIPVAGEAPMAADESEGITGFQWALPDKLPTVAAALRAVPEDLPGRGDWGRFRAVAHDFLSEVLTAP